MSELKPLAQKYSDACDVLVDHKRSTSSDDSRDIKGAVSTARSGVVIGIVVALLFSVVISLFVVRSITAPLANAVGLVDKIAQGDLTQQISATSKDEVGAMLASLSTMLENLRKTVTGVTDRR